MTIIYVVRHSLTEFNKLHIMQGHADSPLLPEGIVTAEKLGKCLLDKKITKIYTSDLGRCVQTTNIINGFLHVPVVLSQQLREQNYGIYNGKSKAFIVSEIDIDNPIIVPPDGESLEQTKDRVVSFVMAINDNDPILVVTHTGGFRGLLSQAYNIPITDPACKVSTATIGVFSITDESLQFITFIDTDTLP